MRHLLLLTIVILINSSVSVSGHSSTLDNSRWHKRLIVAFAAESSPFASILSEHVTAATCDLAERDVDVHLIDNTAAKAAGLNEGDLYRTGDLLKIVH